MREYKGESGIYCITNIVNGKKYIGKTKYVYDLYYEDHGEIGILYKELQERGLSSAIGNFHRRKSDEVICKGVKVIRRKLNESKI